MQAPMAVLTANTKRETGKKAQSGNIMAAKVNLAAKPGCMVPLLALPNLFLQNKNVQLFCTCRPFQILFAPRLVQGPC